MLNSAYNTSVFKSKEQIEGFCSYLTQLDFIHFLALRLLSFWSKMSCNKLILKNRSIMKNLFKINCTMVLISAFASLAYWPVLSAVGDLSSLSSVTFEAARKPKKSKKKHHHKHKSSDDSYIERLSKSGNPQTKHRHSHHSRS